MVLVVVAWKLFLRVAVSLIQQLIVCTQVGYKYVDDLATVWCEWAEMELRHKNFKKALELMRTATAPPANLGQRRVSLGRAL